MLWCVSVAPLGKPVVPDVYWMLIGSSNDSPAMRSRKSLSGACGPSSHACHSGVSMYNTFSRSGSAPRTSSIIAR
uniref:Unannotated protein n=1 Tax=freshwater metagenome TaxID=449393 RepID=A0A6J7M5R8_9ZZZZ